MGPRSILLLLLLGGCRGLSHHYIRFREANYKVFPESSPMLCSGPIPSSLGSPSLLCNELVNFNPTYVEELSLSLPRYSALNATLYDQVWIYGQQVVRAHLKDSHPNVEFVVLDSNIKCVPSLQVAGPQFNCLQGSVVRFQISEIAIDIEREDYEATVTIYANTTQYLAPALTIAFAKLQAVRDLHTSRQNAVQDNHDREKNALTVVGVFYFFIALGILILSFFSAQLTAWFFVVRRLQPTNPMPNSIILWSSVHIAVLVILVTTAGVVGVLAFVALLVVKDVFLGVGYLAIWHKNPKFSPPKIQEWIDLGVAPDERLQTRQAFRDGKVFRYHPYQFSIAQKKLLFTTLACVVAVVLIEITIVFGWKRKGYQVWNRAESMIEEEVTPGMVSKTLAAIYAAPNVASFTKMDVFNQVATSICERRYNTRLSSDADKKQRIFDDFISAYNVDMTIYERTSYLDYSSANDWFTRQLTSDYRKRIQRSSPVDNVLVSPVYGRLMVFEKVPSDQRVWIKDDDFTVSELMGSTSQAQVFEDGALVVLRMNFQDYHRVHSPFDGWISYIGREIGSRLMSVSADAVGSENDVFYNKRRTLVIATEKYGKIAVVIVGSACVGSINLSVSVGQPITKGDELGYFAFGGSTVVLALPPNAVTFDTDLLQNSNAKLESKVELGMRIGDYN